MNKSIKLIAAIALCVMLFASCKKEPTPTPEPAIETGLEGQFMPERKIVSMESFDIIGEDSLRPYIKNSYEWNGDLLTRMTQQQNGYDYYIESFQYDSLNRIKRSVMNFNVEPNPRVDTYDYIYEGKVMVKMNGYHENGELFEDVTIIRENGKPTSFRHAKYDEPTTNADHDFVWGGDNIIQTAVNETGMPLPYDYTYDDKISPLKGFYTSNFFYDPEVLYSANNIVSSTMEQSLGSMTLTFIQTNEYEYDDKGYPVKNTCTMDNGITVHKRVIFYTYME